MYKKRGGKWISRRLIIVESGKSVGTGKRSDTGDGITYGKPWANIEK